MAKLSAVNKNKKRIKLSDKKDLKRSKSYLNCQETQLEQEL